MIRGALPPEALREKLSPPRALQTVGGALYAPPLAGSSVAWLAWLGDGAIDAVIARATEDGARSLAVGGPPGNYLASGVDPGDRDLCELLESKGFREHTRHLELVVSTAAHAPDAGVFSVGDDLRDEVLAWVASTFAAAWSMEASRAHGHGGLFAVRGEEGLGAFACHSGNRAWEGTFGPIGVAPGRRGGGVGRRVASAALHDLGVRGYETATVPWVDAETVRFYESFCDVRSRAWRVEYRARLVGG